MITQRVIETFVRDLKSSIQLRVRDGRPCACANCAQQQREMTHTYFCGSVHTASCTEGLSVTDTVRFTELV